MANIELFFFKCHIFHKAIWLLFSLTSSPPLLAILPCLLSTPRICMHSIVSIEYLKHFQNTKYLNRPDKQVIVLWGYFAKCPISPRDIFILNGYA